MKNKTKGIIRNYTPIPHRAYATHNCKDISRVRPLCAISKA